MAQIKSSVAPVSPVPCMAASSTRTMTENKCSACGAIFKSTYHGDKPVCIVCRRGKTDAVLSHARSGILTTPRHPHFQDTVSVLPIEHVKRSSGYADQCPHPLTILKREMKNVERCAHCGIVECDLQHDLCGVCTTQCKAMMHSCEPILRHPFDGVMPIDAKPTVFCDKILLKIYVQHRCEADPKSGAHTYSSKTESYFLRMPQGFFGDDEVSVDGSINVYHILLKRVFPDEFYRIVNATVIMDVRKFL